MTDSGFALASIKKEGNPIRYDTEDIDPDAVYTPKYETVYYEVPIPKELEDTIDKAVMKIIEDWEKEQGL